MPRDCTDTPAPPRAAVGGEDCGDSVLQGDESCDDGGVSGGDGCSSSCEMEPGYMCEVSYRFPCTKYVAISLLVARRTCPILASSPVRPMTGPATKPSPLRGQ